jgi:hypothetical protein
MARRLARPKRLSPRPRSGAPASAFNYIAVNSDGICLVCGRAGFEWELEIPAAAASGAAGRAALQEAVGKGEFCAAILPDGGKLVHAIGCEHCLLHLCVCFLAGDN